MVAPRSPERGKIPVAGGELAFEAIGSGPPVLFVHSAITDGRLWDREMPRVGAHHRAVRFDLRGYGGSTPATAPFRYVDDIAAVCRHLHLERPLLVGSSMGGAHAIDYALDHPGQVRGLLLVAPGLSGGVTPPFDAAQTAAFEYDDRESQAIATRWTAGDPGGAFDLLRQLWCVALEGEAVDRLRRMVEQNPEEVFADRSAQHWQRSPPAEGRLPTLRVPSTLLIGDRDNPSSAVFADRIARAIPGCRKVPVAGADHLVNLSRPAEFDAALAALLAASA